MYILYIAIVLLVLVRAQQYTDPSQLPGYDNLPGCAQYALGACVPCGENVIADLNCGTWTCVCDDYAQALSAVSAAASGRCSTQLSLTATVQSILSTFCSQLTVPAFPESPTQTNTNNEGKQFTTRVKIYNSSTNL